MLLGSPSLFRSFNPIGLFQKFLFPVLVILFTVVELKLSRWQSILLSDDSSDSESEIDEDGEGEEFTLSREELHNMLRLHKYKKLHQNKYSKDKEVKRPERNSSIANYSGE